MHPKSFWHLSSKSISKNNFISKEIRETQFYNYYYAFFIFFFVYAKIPKTFHCYCAIRSFLFCGLIKTFPTNPTDLSDISIYRFLGFWLKLHSFRDIVFSFFYFWHIFFHVWAKRSKQVWKRRASLLWFMRISSCLGRFGGARWFEKEFFETRKL